MQKTILVAFSLLFMGISSAQAAGPYSPYQGQYQRPDAPLRAETPDQILRQGIDRLKGFLARGGKATETETREFLDKEISRYFDFPYMARWSAGSMYRRMNDKQRVRFTRKLKAMFFSALARNLGTYSGSSPRIDIYRPRSNRYSKEVTVNARVMPQGGYPVRLQFRFYRSPEGWKVFDVTANGISAVSYYRKHFGGMARRY